MSVAFYLPSRFRSLSEEPFHAPKKEILKKDALKIKAELATQIENNHYALINGDTAFKISSQLQVSFLDLKKFYNKRLTEKTLSKERVTSTKFTHQRYLRVGHYSVQNQKITKVETLSKYKKDFDIILRNEFARFLLMNVLEAIPGYDANKKIFVQILYSRHVKSVEKLKAHQDKFDGWIAHFNLNYSSDSLRGGFYKLYNAKEEKPIVKKLANGFLDGYIIDNSLFAHGTSKLTFKEQNQGGTRDVLIYRIYRKEIKKLN